MESTSDKERLKKQLQVLAEKINDDVFNQRKQYIGKILTLVEATTNDVEQRKALKDMINEVFYGPSYWNRIAEWIQGFAKAQGIEKLYDHENAELSVFDSNDAKEIFNKVQ